MPQPRKVACLVASLFISMAVHAQTAPTPAAIAQDPTPDKANPAAIETFQLPSHGALLNALVYVASGPGPHPIVVLLHGFPGNERNLDLAQSIRRAGDDVLFFDYRGSWGSPGDFSFTHCLEDAQSAVAYLRDPVNAMKLRADPKRIVLMGHSMGGMVAAWAAAQDAQITALGLISSANMAEQARLNQYIPQSISGTYSDALAQVRKTVLARVAAGLAAEGMAPLAGCTPESLAAELVDHAQQWTLTSFAPKLATRPVLVVTSDDGGAAASDAFSHALQTAGDRRLTALHLRTDHSYSDHRIALETAVLDFLATLPQK